MQPATAPNVIEEEDDTKATADIAAMEGSKMSISALQENSVTTAKKEMSTKPTTTAEAAKGNSVRKAAVSGFGNKSSVSRTSGPTTQSNLRKGSTRQRSARMLHTEPSNATVIAQTAMGKKEAGNKFIKNSR